MTPTEKQLTDIVAKAIADEGDPGKFDRILKTSVLPNEYQATAKLAKLRRQANAAIAVMPSQALTDAGIRKGLEMALGLVAKHCINDHDEFAVGYNRAVEEITTAIRGLIPPTDWVVVPREPTLEMLEAGMAQMSDRPEREDLAAAYRAMINTKE